MLREQRNSGTTFVWEDPCKRREGTRETGRAVAETYWPPAWGGGRIISKKPYRCSEKNFTPYLGGRLEGTP